MRKHFLWVIHYVKKKKLYLRTYMLMDAAKKNQPRKHCDINMSMFI